LRTFWEICKFGFRKSFHLRGLHADVKWMRLAETELV
jgi:hypothetical protein